MTKTKFRVWFDRLSLPIQLLLLLLIAGGILIYLLTSGSRSPSAAEETRATPPEETVRADGLALRVRPGTPLDDKLVVASVKSEEISSPVLPVTGTVMAKLKPGNKDAWQFATSDLLSAFTDWEKAIVDVQFQKDQLQAVRDLSDYRVEAQKEVVERMEKLMAAGTERLKDVIAERVNLKQFEIQGRKDVHEAENNVKVAEKTEAALARQLQQAGLEPTMLRSAAAEGVVVVAEVPELVLLRVKTGMLCDVKIYALPGQRFTGKVSNLSPVIVKDKRVLNVQFIVKDANDELRPGMFAETGLGTDPRHALMMPADGVLHVGTKDYVLKGGETAQGSGSAAWPTWHIAEVQVGEVHGNDVEVLSGLKKDDRVLGQGAILLKPMVVQALGNIE
jgi:cobalt-zinc-cadmium efflux system membrane fusion protein